MSFGGITSLIPASDVEAAIAFYSEKLALPKCGAPANHAYRKPASYATPGA